MSTDIEKSLRDLIEAIEHTPLGVRALQALSRARAALAADSGAPLSGTPRRHEFVAAARVYALAYGRHEDAPSYLPRTQADADAFEPHAWVIAAMMQAYADGMADGHADGIEFAKAAAPAAAPVAEVTDAMVTAYLRANDAYWKRTDEMPSKPDKWRNGTPTEATRESLRAALAVAPQAPAAAQPDPGAHTTGSAVRKQLRDYYAAMAARLEQEGE